ncbi:tRNA pseudouridine(38-39) synthase [Babesia ovis]|uniref:tRNA pseudouridine synthase n=1 Tax=Babesia ovis TaxID=5869 RepID=A0A9W5WTU9_BABOV|nr:tRNA pseudouridine(38-39) synthase [Babesia ovis]
MSQSDGHLGHCGTKILVDFSYLGTGFHGLAYQVDESNTVEGHLFNAISLAQVASDVRNNGYERCGRTDRDVHALHNYCTFFPDPCPSDGPCATAPIGKDGQRPCYRINSFAKAINKHLPRSIRINSVHQVPDNFSSRRDCTFRTYKYFFQLGTMDLGLMHEASQHFVGSHDFSQFCKTDNRNPKDPHGTVYTFTVDRYNELLCVATVSGRAFLWHQVRCMMGMLFLVGEGVVDGLKIKALLEQPEGPKFNYKMASAHGLILVDCGFEIPKVSGSTRNRALYQVGNFFWIP